MSELEYIQRRVDREIQARKHAETILEQKALELFEANIRLSKLNEQLEQRVEIQERQYKQLVEEASDFIFNFSPELVLTFVNNQAIKLSNLSKDELLGKPIADFIHNDHKEEAREFFRRLRDGESESSYVEFPIVFDTSHHIWLGMNVNIVQEDNASYYSVIGRDITQRKLVEKELALAMSGLERSEYKYRGIIQNLNLGMVELDSEMRIVHANSTLLEMIGYTIDELQGKRQEEIFVEKDNLPEFLQQERVDPDTIEPVYELRLTSKNEDTYHTLVSVAPIHNIEGDPAGLACIHYDISELRRLTDDLRIAKDIAEGAQKAEKKFLAVMTHEMRTPLNAIVGMSHLLKDTTLDEEQAEYIHLITNAADILQSLVSDVLDISKIDAGKVEVNFEEVELNEILNNTAKSVRVKHPNPKVELIYQSSIGSEVWSRSDKQLIQQIVTNLLDNAMKFTHEGSVKLLLENGKNDWIRIAVEDTGIGISESRIDAIFEEFEQADASIQGIYGGTGLGLSISRKLAGLLNTELIVNSKIGQGTTFYFDLPQLEKVNNQQTPNQISEVSDTSNYVLVAEDNLMNLKYVTKLLEKKGFKFAVAKDGKEAMEKSDQESFDIILMDIQMPFATGHEVTEYIRKGDGPNKKTPIIALTASTLASQRQKSIESGMDEFISKPFSPDTLFSLMDQLAGKESDKKSSTLTIDQDYITAYYGEDVEYKLDMFNTFLESTPFELEKLIRLAAEGDLDKLSQVAHKIKPTFTMVGFPQLTNLMKEIEQSARNKEESVREIVQVKYSVLKDAVEMIKKEVSELQEKQ